MVVRARLYRMRHRCALDAMHFAALLQACYPHSISLPASQRCGLRAALGSIRVYMLQRWGSSACV